MNSGKIFISYRREDTSGESGRLKDKLEQIFGKENIFYDVETLEAGLNFDQSIAKALSESQVLLAMIGPHWLKVSDSKGVSRIQKPEDWVRKEISEALKRGLRVIPILVNGAKMPDADELPEDLKELSLKHAQEVSSSRWNYDVGELIKVLERIVSRKTDPQPRKESIFKVLNNPQNPKRKNYLRAFGGLILLLGAFISWQSYTNNRIEESEAENLVSTAEQLTDTTHYYPQGGVEWTLIEKRNNIDYPSTIYFEYLGDSIFFYQTFEDSSYNGEGIAQVDYQKLSLYFTKSNYDSSGKILLTTLDSGNTWQGTSSYPNQAVSFDVDLH